VSSVFDDPDAAIARVEDQIRAAQERAERAGQVRQRLDGLRGQARSRRGEVTALADVSGRLLDLSITAEAFGDESPVTEHLRGELIGRLP
jgi:hypothetical protein